MLSVDILGARRAKARHASVRMQPRGHASIPSHAPMRIAVCSDELYPVNTYVRDLLEAMGHEVVPFGAMADGKEAPLGHGR